MFGSFCVNSGIRDFHLPKFNCVTTRDPVTELKVVGWMGQDRPGQGGTRWDGIGQDGVGWNGKGRGGLGWDRTG